MIRVIVGKKGSGKTKQVIEMINSAVDTEHGNVVCIEKGEKLMLDISHKIRLVEASEYDIADYTAMKGFISGLHAGNFDISHIFIDGLYKLSGSKNPDETAEFLAWAEAFGKTNKMEFTISISDEISALPESVTKYL